MFTLPFGYVSNGGFLEGLLKALTHRPYDFLKEQDGYFVRIKVIKLCKHLDFPLTNKIDEDGVRNFTNNMDNETIYIYIYIYIYISIKPA